MGGMMKGITGAGAVWVAMAYAQRVLITNGGDGKGKQRSSREKAIALLPLLPLFLYLPWQPGSCHARALLAMVFLWTAPSKLLLLCRGTPLDPLPFVSASLPSFAMAVLLPVRVRAAEKEEGCESGNGCGSVIAEVLLLVGILNLYPAYPDMATALRYFMYCLHFYLGLRLAMRAIAGAASGLFGVRVHTQFDSPYASASLREFWGRRWNVMVSSVLRATVYEPALQALGFGAGRGPRWARAAATLAVFAVSGLVHELVFVYVSKGPPTGEMTAFFLIHGLASIAESLARRTLPLPTPLSNLATLSFLYATASLFFLRPLRRTAVDRLAIAEYHQLQSAALSPFLRPVSHVPTPGF